MAAQFTEVEPSQVKLPPQQTVPNFVDAETPGGAVNGVNTEYTTANVPSPATSLHVYWNGLRQNLGTDYTLNAGGTTSTPFTFTMAQIPQTGDTLLVDYRH